MIDVSISSLFLVMLTGPFKISEPSILLVVGSCLLLFGSGILITTRLKPLGVPKRTRIILALTLAATAFGVTLDRPFLRNGYYTISVAVVMLLPLMITMAAVRELVQ
jgi:hypothetical protein